MKRKLSGRTRLILGALTYLKEEFKTLNLKKIKALGKILSGYVEMKFRPSKKKLSQRKLSPGLDDI